MKRILTTLAAVIALTMPASGATISQFKKSTNDGVYDLTTSQAAALGFGSASHIGFFRIREGSGTTFDAGDTFDATTIMASLRGGSRNNVIAILNGRNGGLGYTGGFLEVLQTTTIGDANSYYEGVAILFNGNTVNFGGGNFNRSQSRGTYDGTGIPAPAAVPLPAAGWFLIAGIGGLVVMSRRRKLASA
ncbi:MAG: VPLPA-CTERM sorting domain-containing protein [Pseudomonadota bacterium]